MGGERTLRPQSGWPPTGQDCRKFSVRVGVWISHLRLLKICAERLLRSEQKAQVGGLHAAKSRKLFTDSARAGRAHSGSAKLDAIRASHFGRRLGPSC